MVAIELKKFENLNDSSRAILLFLVSILVSKITGPLYGPVLFFVSVVLLSARYIPSKFSIQRLAISSVLLIGLSPIYLIARGYFFKRALSTLDLQIYCLIFFLCILTAHHFSTKQFKRHEINQLKMHQKNVFGAFFGLTFALIVEILLKGKSIGHAVSWVASGDSKNHFVNGVTLSELGFLNPQSFLVQPSSSPAYLSLVLSQISSGIDNAISRMPDLMNSYALVWIVLLGTLGLTFAGLTEIIWKNFHGTSEIIPTHILALSSLIPLFSFIVGPALYDGFFSAIFGISTVVVLLAWFIEMNQLNDFSIQMLIVGMVLFVCAVTAWMFVTPFTLLLVVAGARSNFRKLPNLRKFIDVLLLAGAGISVLIVHKSYFVQTLIYKAKLSLTASGAVNASNPVYFAALLAIIAMFGIILVNRGMALGKLLIEIVLFQLIALLGFKKFSNLKVFEWNYYLVKYQWIMFAVLISLVFSLAVTGILVLIRNNPLHYASSMILLVFIVFMTSESVVPTNKIWQKVWSGWENPRSLVMNKALAREIDRKNPTMFFHYGYGGDSKLANFWLNGFADPLDPIKGWNYTIDTTGDPKQLCDVNAYYPEVTVVTSDSKLEDDLAKLCGDEVFNIELEAPLL